MRWPTTFGNALIATASCILLIEFGEFAVLAWVWGFATAEKAASLVDNSVILGTTLVTLLGTLLLATTAMISISRRLAWPTMRIFSSLVGFVAVTQLLFFLMGEVNFKGDWLNEFFRTKSPTFAAGLVSALLIAFMYALVRPWRKRPPAGPPSQG